MLLPLVFLLAIVVTSYVMADVIAIMFYIGWYISHVQSGYNICHKHNLNVVLYIT